MCGGRVKYLIISSDGALAISRGAWAPRMYVWRTSGRKGGRLDGKRGGRERAKEQRCLVATVTRHEWLHARRRRTCYARSSALHAHSHKTRRSNFLSSSLSKPWFASALTLHESFSEEALGLSPAFSPAAVKPLSSLFLPAEPNILLGKQGLLRGWGDATGAPPPRFFLFCCCCSPLFLYVFIKPALMLYWWR